MVSSHYLTKYDFSRKTCDILDYIFLEWCHAEIHKRCIKTKKTKFLSTLMRSTCVRFSATGYSHHCKDCNSIYSIAHRVEKIWNTIVKGQHQWVSSRVYSY